MGANTSSFSDPSHEKALLIYAKAFSPLISRLSPNIIREISSYFGFLSYIVPALCGNTLRLFDIKRENVQESMLTVKITAGAVYGFIDIGQILTVGGHPEANSAWLVSTVSSKAIVLEEMHAARAWPGICIFREIGYVFGGNFPSICRAEKWDLQTRKWTKLRDMAYSRFAFTPCRYGENIYLVDFSQSHKRAEVFSIRSEAFTLIPMRLPGFYCLSSLCFLQNGHLVVLCEGIPGETVCWRLSREGTTETTKIRSQGIRACAPCPLLRCKEVVFYSSVDDRQLVRFDLATETFRKEMWGYIRDE
jgi:hypothetical protein